MPTASDCARRLPGAALPLLALVLALVLALALAQAQGWVWVATEVAVVGERMPLDLCTSPRIVEPCKRCIWWR